MKKNILYLHGFASSGNSPKVNHLRSMYPGSVYAPNLPFDPDRVIEQLTWEIRMAAREGNSIMLVGTSLGGFYSSVLAGRFDIPAIIINPAVIPHQSKTITVGKHTNFNTGEEFEVTFEHLEQLRSLSHELMSVEQNNINLVLCKDDDVIPYEGAKNFWHHARTVTIFETGGHRFDDMSLIDPLVKEVWESL